MSRSLESRLVPIASWVAAILIYFRYTLLSGFSNVTGDQADGQLIYSIHEHWYRVFQGLESWHNLSFFYPLENVLGYSDTFLGPGIVYVLFRLIGLDPHLSAQVVVMVLASIGFWSMYFWLTRFRKVSISVSAFVSVLFVVASPMFLATRNSHLQLLSVWQFPLGLLLLEMVIRSMDKTSRETWLWFLLLATWFGLLTYSTFYAAYFFGLLILLAIIGALIRCGPKNCLSKLSLPFRSWRHFIPGMIALTGFAVLFLVAYLPIRMEMGGRSFPIVLDHLPGPWDLFNHSETNLVWGPLAKHLWPYSGFNPMGKELGLSPLFFFMVLGVSVWVLIKPKSSTPLVWVSAFVFVLGSLLIIRFGDFSLWIVPFKLIPGSEGLRAVFRFNLALLIPAFLILTAAIQWIFSQKSRSWTCIGLLVLSIIFLEQIQVTTNANLSRSDKIDLLASTPRPPSAADAFYLVGTAQKEWQKDILHGTAIYLAQSWNVPTLNGRSGFLPPGYELYSLESWKAEPSIRNWANQHRLTGNIAVYNVDTGKWISAIELEKKPLPLLDGINLLDHREIFYPISGYGWSIMEPWGIWSDRRKAGFKFEEGAFPSGVRSIQLKAVGFTHENSPIRDIDIRINGEFIQRIRFTTERSSGEWRINLGNPIKRVRTLEFRILDPASPNSVGIGNDSRELGIGLSSLILSSR